MSGSMLNGLYSFLMLFNLHSQIRRVLVLSPFDTRENWSSEQSVSRHLSDSKSRNINQHWTIHSNHRLRILLFCFFVSTKAFHQIFVMNCIFEFPPNSYIETLTLRTDTIFFIFLVHFWIPASNTYLWSEWIHPWMILFFNGGAFS